MWRSRLTALQCHSGSGGRDLASRSPGTQQVQLTRMHAESISSKAPRAVGLAVALGAGSATQASCTASNALSVRPGKPYLTKPSVVDAFAPKELALTLGLGAVEPFVAQMNAAMKRSADASSAGRVRGETHDEDGKRLTPFALIQWDRLREDVFFNCLKRLTANVLLSASQLALWNCLDGEEDQRIIAKFIKNVATSAVSGSLLVAML